MTVTEAVLWRGERRRDGEDRGARRAAVRRVIVTAVEVLTAAVEMLNGTALVYPTFVGGSDMEFGNGIAVDAGGNAYVTGTTKSSNLPTTGGAFDRSLNTLGNCPRCGIDNTDGFVFKLNAAGSQLTYSTYLGGGADIDSPRGIAGRRSRKRVRRRRDAVQRLPDDGRCLRPYRSGATDIGRDSAGGTVCKLMAQP